MATTSNSPRKVMAVAWQVGMDALPTSPHRFAPHRFTQSQLFACLVRRVCEGWDYRTTEEHLRDEPGLRVWIGLQSVPDRSTLHRALVRIFGQNPSRKLRATCIHGVMGRRRIIPRAAADGTGLESRHVSPYLVPHQQRGQPVKEGKNPLYQTTCYTRFPKMTLRVDCRSHRILAILPGRVPRPDVDERVPLLGPLCTGVRLRRIVADAGFDSAGHHRFLRQEHGLTRIIPPPPMGDGVKMVGRPVICTVDGCITC